MHGLDIEVIRPKKDRIPSEKMDFLIGELYDVALDSFAKYLPYEAINSRTRDSDYIIVLRDKIGKAVGYSVNELLYLDGIAVNYYATALLRRSIQRKGLYSILNELRYDSLPADAIMTRTQNPVIYRSFSRLCREKDCELHPNGVDIPKNVKMIAKAHSPDVDDNLVVRGVYFGRSLMDDTPKPKGEEIKVWSNLDVNSGDAVILIGINGKT